MTVRVYDVRRRAERAITERLRYHAPDAIISADYDLSEAGRDFQAVILHVNSGDNAIACHDALRRAGYTVEETDYDPFAPGHYGVQLRVRKP